MTELLTTRDKLERLISRNPSLSLADLAEYTSVSRARVQQLLAEMGYEYEPGKWMPSAKKTKPTDLHDEPRV